jgi:hypothetical protein
LQPVRYREGKLAKGLQNNIGVPVDDNQANPKIPVMFV